MFLINFLHTPLHYALLVTINSLHTSKNVTLLTMANMSQPSCVSPSVSHPSTRVPYGYVCMQT